MVHKRIRQAGRPLSRVIILLFFEVPFEIHSFVQDADNQDVALRTDRVEDYVMPTMETIQAWYDFIILF